MVRPWEDGQIGFLGLCRLARSSGEGIDPLLDRVEVVAHGLAAAGRTQATSRELLELVGDPRPTDEQLGTVLGALGAKGRRMRIGDARLRFYDLGGLRPNGGSTSEPTVADQRPGPAAERARQDQKVLVSRWSSGPPIEN